jgi:hypothetical protein
MEQNGCVRFHYKDYADAGKMKQMTLTAEEFIRRFLLHVLPKGFVRIRHYGLLASPNVQTKLKRCQWLLGPTNSVQTETMPLQIDWGREGVEPAAQRCPHCGHHLTTIAFDHRGIPVVEKAPCNPPKPVPLFMDSS